MASDRRLTPPMPSAIKRLSWFLWFALLAALGVLYAALGRRPVPADLPAAESLTGLVALIPLFLSIVIRWLMLRRATHPRRAFALYVVGLALAEMCGLLGLFLGGPYRDDLVVLALLGIIQFTPFLFRNSFFDNPAGRD